MRTTEMHSSLPADINRFFRTRQPIVRHSQPLWIHARSMLKQGYQVEGITVYGWKSFFHCKCTLIFRRGSETGEIDSILLRSAAGLSANQPES
ncbi:hypothetical protein R1flu_021557 [Riccia fluitans]|uniref:Uncharacterized protein n=1 Tax=Riccia fluitans TaxID=41844 RepID=A0ABD1ZPP8_9MARC